MRWARSRISSLNFLGAGTISTFPWDQSLHHIRGASNRRSPEFVVTHSTPIDQRRHPPERATFFPVTHLDRRILDAWAATADWHAPNPAAAPDGVTAAEHAIGRRLPQAFRELYLVHDGGGWLGHNLNLLPLDDGNEAGEGSVTRAAAAFRRWDWPVPDEVVVIGNNGAGDIFGLWLPKVEERPLVVTIGAIFEPGCMGIAGQDLNAFLRARTAYHLLLPADDTMTAGLDALDVPVELRSQDPDDTMFTQMLNWASPTVPPSLMDAYEADLLQPTCIESPRGSEANLSVAR